MRAVRLLAFAGPWLLISAIAPLWAQQADWQQMHNHVAELLVQRRYAELLPAALQTLRVAESTFGVLHPATAVSTYDVALAYDALHQHGEAETFYRRALTLEEKTLGPNSLEIPKFLNNLAMLYFNNHRELEAEPLLQRALDMLQRSPDPAARANMIGPLMNLAAIYRGQKKNDLTEGLYRQALVIAEQNTSPGPLPVDMILYPLATLYNEEGKLRDAEIVLKRALGLCERTYGVNEPQTARILGGLGATQANLGNYQEAESTLRRALRIQEETAGPESEVAELLSNLAAVYRIQGKRADEEPLLRRILVIREKVLGADNPQVINTLIRLGVLYRDQGRSADSGVICQRALSLQEKTIGSTDPALASALMCVAAAQMEQQKFSQSETTLKRVIQILEVPNVKQPDDLANVLNSLAELYRNAGRFAEAEALYRRSLDITKRTRGESNADYARVLNNLGLLYADQGRWADAEPLHKQSLAIMEKAAGLENVNTTYALNSLAQAYMETDRYAAAEPLLRRALKIREAAYGLDHPLVGTIVNNLAVIYKRENRCADAEPLQRRALAIDEKRLGSEHPIVAVDLSNLGGTWECLGRYPEAGQNYQRALQIADKALGPNHPGIIIPLKNLASYHYGLGDYAQAAPLFNRLLGSVEYQFRYQFGYMSEKDRLSFLATVDDVFPRYFSFCLQFHDRDPSLAGHMYDLALWEKGLIARSVVSLRNQVSATGDSQALATLQQLTSRKAQLSTLELNEIQHPGTSPAAIAQLQHEVNDLETDLVRRSSAFANRRRLDTVRWSEVAKALGPGESAVELLRFRFHDGKKWQRIQYAALILSSGAAMPKVLSLGDAWLLEGTPLSDYRERVKFGPPPDDNVGSVFYRNIWKPIEASLVNAKRIYLSPDGLMSEVSWSVLPSGDGRLLLERYEINLLSSTRDLLNKSSGNTARSAVLIGAPDFDLPEGAYRAALQKSATRHSADSAMGASAPAALRAGDGHALAPLPGTVQELQSIRAILQQHGWTITMHMGPDALEENVKAIQSPQVLHLATHGFFTPVTEQADAQSPEAERADQGDPMLRSGLYLAGANPSLVGKLRTGLDDGVLTAFEASNLNLAGTELVVLSACETGLGVTRNGEGVFGLRRALQEAGAKAVLMSLWKVPDQETEELMKLFYEKWLSGKDKQKALREAQLEMRERVKARRDGDDIPFYWGAFVLVGN